MLNSLPSPVFPGEPMRGERLCIYVRNVSFPVQETGRCFHVNGITVNKTTQTVESAAAGGAFHIEDVYPLIDGGRFPVKRVAGERVEVWADIYRDGHDVVNAALVWRRERDREWRREPMTHHSNDRWGGSFVPEQPGRYVYAIEAWTDEFATWRHGFRAEAESRRRFDPRRDRGRWHAHQGTGRRRRGCCRDPAAM